MSPFSRRSARTPLHNNLSLRQRAEINENTIARNEEIQNDREVEAILVDPDWKMRSPSPVELYYTPIYSTFTPTDFYESDIVMVSPTHPTRSPTPEQIQDSANLGSSWGAEPPYSPAPTEVLRQNLTSSESWGVDPPHSPTSGDNTRSWGYSPWETDASQDESTEDSSLRGTDATHNESTEDSSSTPGALQEAWESFSW
ncbi:hypothetical protein P692DRAFT_20833991 [Suillus brevipes Sb2]|nr:hypothetical protein P692DRAFT_20833991 [Suillus brevipes Sb2]